MLRYILALLAHVSSFEASLSGTLAEALHSMLRPPCQGSLAEALSPL